MEAIRFNEQLYALQQSQDNPYSRLYQQSCANSHSAFIGPDLTNLVTQAGLIHDLMGQVLSDLTRVMQRGLNAVRSAAPKHDQYTLFEDQNANQSHDLGQKQPNIDFQRSQKAVSDSHSVLEGHIGATYANRANSSSPNQSIIAAGNETLQTSLDDMRISAEKGTTTIQKAPENEPFVIENLERHAYKKKSSQAPPSLGGYHAAGTGTQKSNAAQKQAPPVNKAPGGNFLRPVTTNTTGDEEHVLRSNQNSRSSAQDEASNGRPLERNQCKKRGMRSQLQGFDCQSCQDFYKALTEDAKTPQEFLLANQVCMKCSRHRDWHPPNKVNVDQYLDDMDFNNSM